jgi:DNA-binding CsgD family transcriptional regulator
MIVPIRGKLPPCRPLGNWSADSPACHLDKMSHLFYRRIREIADVSDVESLRTQLACIGAEMGFGLYSAIVTKRRPGRPWRSFMVHNASPAWEAATRDAESSERDPFLNRMKRVSVPATYDQSFFVGADCGDLWEEQAAHGYKTGIGAALHLPEGKHALIGFDREEPLPGDETRLARLLADLQLLTVHAHEAAFRLLLPQSSGEVSLTERQLDVLRWIARGKTAWATGRILGLSERTVNGHLAAIYAKLDAGTQSQAVFNAVGLGLL